MSVKQMSKHLPPARQSGEQESRVVRPRVYLLCSFGLVMSPLWAPYVVGIIKAPEGHRISALQGPPFT